MFDVSPSVTRRTEQGIALVITLILLSVTLVMAVAFLAIANRERNAVTTTTDTATARHGAEPALAYAAAQIVANILSSTNAAAYNFNLLVSTNYINAAGFDPNSGNPTNVNYDYLVSGGTLTTANQRNQNIANLWFLPRAPVFITNRVTGSVDFRYYLDLNRNGRFETNGFTSDFDSANPPNVLGSSFKVGDPEWIGILERPDAPHGPDNKFVARVAFLAQPIGNSLDLNAIHNEVELAEVNPAAGGKDSFLRNQGVGSWEINLAAFLADLNTNQWNNPLIQPYQYYEPGSANRGYAFEDALSLLSYRYGNIYASLARVGSLYANGGALQNEPFDIFPFGPLMTNTAASYYANNINNYWAGSDNTNHFFALSSDLFDSTKSSPAFVNRLQTIGQAYNPNNTDPTNNYNRYTFYRMLDQLGTDSTADSGKMNLNWDNLSPVINGFYNTNGIAATTNFFAWQPLTFFTNAADRMLRTYTANWFASNPTNYLMTYYAYTPVNYVAPNGYGLTNFPYSGMINQAPAFGIGNIPVFVYGQFVYSPAVNRVLQLAANIYDASTNSFYPSVFRPTFWVTNQFGYRNVYINGYEDVSRYSQLNPLTIGSPPLDPPVDVTSSLLVPDEPLNLRYGNVYGVPWIIGAKKGFPNFNLLSMVNSAQVTRKLMVSRSTTNPATATYRTNQMYVMSITNNIGVSFWNSYAADYTNRSGQPITVYVSDWLDMTLTNGAKTWPVPTALFTMSTNMNIWPGSRWSGQPPNATINGNPFIATNWTYAYLPQSIYRFGTKSFDPVGSPTSPLWETTTPSPLPPLPQFGLMTTNRLQAMILDGNNVIDYVQLRGPINNRDLSAELADPDYAVADNIYYQWSINGPSAAPPNYGVLNQLAVSRNSTLAKGLSPNAWVRPLNMPSFLGNTPQDEADFFDGFFLPSKLINGINYTNTLLSIQTPYTPSRAAYDYTLWQANDPLVHYLASDLNYVDPGNMGLHKSDDAQKESVPVVSQYSYSIGPRYQPWGKIAPNALLDSGHNFVNPHNLIYKDPLVWASDYWDFPTNQYPTVGWIGRVHRGTPWQTVYLKATDVLNGNNNVGINTWSAWTGDTQTNYGQYYDAANSAPLQDRLLFDVFTTSFNDNAARGTLSVNVGAGNPSPSAGLAAWSALFSGMVALSNSVSDIRLSFLPAATTSWIINPAGVDVPNSAVGKIVSNIYNTRTNTSLFPLAAFTHVGDILSVPALTEQSPFLKTYTNGIADAAQLNKGISDEVYEWLPQQMMSLLRCPTGPHYVIYCYGQTLKPAPGGLVTSSSNFKLVTNYQVVAESAVRAVIRVDKHVTVSGTNYSTTVESYNPLPPN